MVAVGKPIDEEDLISNVTSRLNPSFHPFGTSYNLATCATPLYFDDFQLELLNHEMMFASTQQLASTAGGFLYTYKNGAS